MDAKQLESLLLRATQIPPGAERERYLFDVCRGNPGLRTHLELLLADSADVEHQLNEELASDDALEIPTPPLPGEGVGTVIAGRYRLVELLGEGGMGTVYKADQEFPVEREVAVKLIRSGMDTRPMLARFEAERQALGMMDHPNIARVLDGGATASGRPYFVMELVDGTPITKMCDAMRLPVRERLELFIAVCRAVQHAHQKGIIHRDLKPSNVLVAMIDGKPTPKIIDFGVAKP
ncbi:MAG TPA: serine/threonine-protein kinase, partial [Planctomycetia bacterium]|nr:serine/threonine-protein kinase [Planctomycetia bacterium]